MTYMPMGEIWRNYPTYNQACFVPCFRYRIALNLDKITTATTTALHGSAVNAKRCFSTANHTAI